MARVLCPKRGKINTVVRISKWLSEWVKKRLVKKWILCAATNGSMNVDKEVYIGSPCGAQNRSQWERWRREESNDWIARKQSQGQSLTFCTPTFTPLGGRIAAHIIPNIANRLMWREKGVGAALVHAILEGLLLLPRRMGVGFAQISF